MTTRSAPFWTVVARKPSAQKKGVGGGAASDAQVDDVSGFVTSFKLVDAEKGPDKLTLTVENYDYKLFDRPLFATGNTLEVSFGYAEARSPVREFVITKMTGGEKLTVEAQGKAYLMTTERRVRTFEYMTHSEIVHQIAEEYGFDAGHRFIEDTSITEAVYAQASMTDHHVLSDLARRNGFVHWIDYRGFHWRKRDLKQEPRRKITYFRGNDVISPPKVENDITGKPATYTAKGIDPKTKQPIGATADNDKTKRDGLAKILTITKTGAAGGYKTKAPNPVGSSVTKATSEKTQAAAQAQTNGAYAKMQLTAAKVKFTMVGDPLLEAKTIVTLDGFSQCLAGNYYITEITHSLGNGFKSEVTCRRDGTSSAALAPGASATDKQSQAAVNKQKADDAAKEDTKMLIPISKTGAPGAVQFVPKGGGKTPPKT